MAARRNGHPYVYGAAAPKLEPERRPLEEPRKKPVRHSSVRTNSRVRRNQEKALQMDLPYVILLTIASLCTLYLLSLIHI